MERKGRSIPRVHAPTLTPTSTTTHHIQLQSISPSHTQSHQHIPYRQVELTRTLALDVSPTPYLRPSWPVHCNIVCVMPFPSTFYILPSTFNRRTAFHFVPSILFCSHHLVSLSLFPSNHLHPRDLNSTSPSLRSTTPSRKRTQNSYTDKHRLTHWRFSEWHLGFYFAFFFSVKETLLIFKKKGKTFRN